MSVVGFSVLGVGFKVKGFVCRVVRGKGLRNSGLECGV